MNNVLTLGAASVLATAGTIAQTSWAVDPVHSNVKFAVTHLVISEVEGNFKVFSGILRSSNGADFSKAEVDFTVDATSVNTENEMRDNHLRSEDFFNAQKFPAMRFKSTSWKKIDETNYLLEGDLTIRDITKHVLFTVTYGGTMTDGYGNIKAGFKASTVINRFDYGLKWNALTEMGGATVGQDVRINLNLQFVQQKSS